MHGGLTIHKIRYDGGGVFKMYGQGCFNCTTGGVLPLFEEMTILHIRSNSVSKQVKSVVIPEVVVSESCAFLAFKDLCFRFGVGGVRRCVKGI